MHGARRTPSVNVCENVAVREERVAARQTTPSRTAIVSAHPSIAPRQCLAAVPLVRRSGTIGYALRQLATSAGKILYRTGEAA
jgi:hypothetical protein